MLFPQAVSGARAIFTGQPVISELLKISILTISVAPERRGGGGDCCLPFGN